MSENVNNSFLERVASPEQLIFLGEKGLTSSEANHTANLVTEFLRTRESIWDNTGAYNQVMSFEGKHVELTKYAKIDLIKNAQIAGQFHAVTAWLREGIKAKDSILDAGFRCDLSKFALDEDDVIEPVSIKVPQLDSVTDRKLTENDIIADWSIADRCEYLTLESLAAGIGKKIHSGKPLARLRSQLQTMKPQEFKELADGNGVKSYVVTNKPVYTNEEMEESFFTLQEIHRKHEQRLNFLKAKVKNDLAAKQALRKGAIQTENNHLYKKYVEEKNIYDAAMKAHNQKLQEQVTVREQRRIAFTNYVSSLRIVIPTSLEPWLEDINILRIKK